MLWGLFLLLLIILLIASIPTYPYSRGWGYTPAGVLAAVIVVYLLLVWFGVVALWYPWAPAPVVVD